MKRKGFTLIELLVVIAIIGLLSTLAVTALGGARTKARDARRLADIKQMQTALEMYYSDKTDYPNPTGADVVLGASAALCLSDFAGFAATCGPSTATIYMGKVPTDPKYDTAGLTTVYKYKHYANTNTYSIQYYLETGAGGLTGPAWQTASEKGISQ